MTITRLHSMTLWTSVMPVKKQVDMSSLYYIIISQSNTANEHTILCDCKMKCSSLQCGSIKLQQALRSSSCSWGATFSSVFFDGAALIAASFPYTSTARWDRHRAEVESQWLLSKPDIWFLLDIWLGKSWKPLKNYKSSHILSLQLFSFLNAIN